MTQTGIISEQVPLDTMLRYCFPQPNCHPFLVFHGCLQKWLHVAPYLLSLRQCWTCAASIARRVYVRQNLGVGALRVHYGGRNKRKGVVPEHFAKASGGLIRHILKQLGESCQPNELTVIC